MSKFLIVMCLSVMPLFAHAQKAEHKKARHGKHKQAKVVVPSWAAAHQYDAMSHAYFPDYYTYYDPARGGYVFWKNGQWTFTPTMPPFMAKVDMSKSRVQILKGLSLDLHPEQNYPQTMKLYPAEHKYDMVPVPLDR